MPLSNWDKANLHKIMAGHGDWTTAQVLRFIALMASKNRLVYAKLKGIFPEECRAYEWWWMNDADEKFDG